jgi:RNA polymerase sigma factor (sigma-70 family)
VLPNEADAEDAFQATFLILALKARSITPREMVAAWLHGVARQVALKARRTNVRRAKREHPVAELPEPAAPHTTTPGHDLLAVLDLELNHLPDRYRSVLILCDLEGITRQAAARQLSLPEGTVNSRLARGRALLAQRLTKRGVVLSGGALALVLSQCAEATVSVSVITSTVRVATLTATAGAVPAGTSANIATLTHGIGSTMLATKFKLVMTAALLLGALGVTGALAVGRTDGTDPDARSAPAVHEKEQGKSAAIRGPGKPGQPDLPRKAGTTEKPGLIRGAVKEIDGSSILLVGGERALLTEKTEYLRETGDDAAPAKRSDITKGTLVYIVTRKQGTDLVATVVVIELMNELIQPPRPKEGEGNKDKTGDERKLIRDPDAVMKAMDGFRKELPPPQGLGEMNGVGVADINGETHPDSHLAGIASRLGVKTRAECMVLLTYLKDPDPKIRRIAAFALNGAVNAYPNGMSSDDIQKVDSDGHRKMVKAFIAGIEKLPR